MIATKAIKPRKAAQPSEVCAKMTSSSGEVGSRLMMEFCQRVLNEKEMPGERPTTELVPIFEVKCDVSNCNACWRVKQLQHEMKVDVAALERRIRILMNIDALRFRFMPRGKNDQRIECCEKNARGIER